jgi:hypothetical protein
MPMVGIRVRISNNLQKIKEKPAIDMLAVMKLELRAEGSEWERSSWAVSWAGCGATVE